MWGNMTTSSNLKFITQICAFALVTTIALTSSPIFAASDRGTADEAIALVKKAKAFISKNGKEKGLEEISRKDGPFVDRDLYVVVYDNKGTCLAHGANQKLIGKDLSDNQDVDGVYYIKDRIELATKKASFWQDYKFTNPVSKKIEPKSMYCETEGSEVVCSGIYK
jgi:signal transduction histidine kinase